MGCGASSTYVKESSTSGTQLGTASSMMTSTASTASLKIQPTEAVKVFTSLEGSIQAMEESKCFEKYRIISEDLGQLKIQFQKYHQYSNHIRHQINQEKNKSNLPAEMSLRDLLLRPGPHNTNLVELFNKQEINDIQLELIQKDIDNLGREMRDLKMVCDQLQDLYQQRDGLLNKQFEGHYGSERESQLEAELDKLLEERHYIEVAKIRWIHSDNLLVDALNFLDMSAAKVTQLQQQHEMPSSDLMHRYACLQEARNNLILFHYNLMSVHNILNVQLPHLTVDDLGTLNNMIMTLFNQIELLKGTADKQQQQQPHQATEVVANFVAAMRTKTVTQHKWVREVVNTTIKTDLLLVRDRCRRKIQELRFERTTLIRQKVNSWPQQSPQPPPPPPPQQQQQQQSAKVDSPFELRVDSGVDSELDESATLMNDEQIARIFASGKDSITSPEMMNNNTPLLPGEVLAPMPSNKEIFGKVIELRTRHQHNMQEYEQNQRLVRVKMSQGLRDKLNHRRSRRSRMEMHRRQLEALQESPPLN